MPDNIYEKVNLMLRLYEMRREEKLRKARAWFIDQFSAATPEEMMAKYPPGTEENAYVRMTTSYGDMCSAIANRGLLDEDLYDNISGEAWVVWEKIKHLVPAYRAAFQNPHIFAELEEYCRGLEAWREKRAPGSTVRTRQMIQMLAEARAKAAQQK
jgi:hypothetical protein